MRTLTQSSYACASTSAGDGNPGQVQRQDNTVDHFFEKLLLLKRRMRTAKGKALAEGRHRVMQQFLGQMEQEVAGLA